MYQSSPSPWGLEMYPILPAYQCRDCHCFAVHILLLSEKPHPEDTKNALPLRKKTFSQACFPCRWAQCINITFLFCVSV